MIQCEACGAHLLPNEVCVELVNPHGPDTRNVCRACYRQASGDPPPREAPLDSDDVRARQARDRRRFKEAR